MVFENLHVGRLFDGVVALVHHQEVDEGHLEEVVVQRVQKHLVDHHEDLKQGDKIVEAEY